MEKLVLETITAQRFKCQEIIYNINRKLIMLLDSYYKLINPIWPKCDSKTVIKHEYPVINQILEGCG